LSFGTNDFKSDDRDRQIDLLVQVLPDDCIKRLLNEDWDSLNNMETKTVLSLSRLKANARGWSAQSISRFRSTFCKVLMWLDENEYPVKPDGSVAPMYLTLYFSEWRAKFHEHQVQNNWQKPNVTHHGRQRTAPQMRNPMLWYLPYPPRGKVTIFLDYELLGLTRHHVRAIFFFKVVHGLDTTHFEVSNGDKITLNSHGKRTLLT